MFAAILAALQAFVELSKDVKLGISTWVKYQDAQWKEALNEVSSTLNGQTTTEQKQDAARKLADLVAKLG